MRKNLLAGVFLAVCLVFISGCMLRPSVRVAETSSTAIQAAVLSDDPADLYTLASVGVILLGVGSLVFGSRSAAATLFISGVGIAYFGQTLSRYPWLSLGAILLAGGAAVLAAFDRWRAGRQADERLSVLETLVGVIQERPEGEAIKAGITALGSKIENKVRSVVTPIKQSIQEGE